MLGYYTTPTLRLKDLRSAEELALDFRIVLCCRMPACNIRCTGIDDRGSLVAEQGHLNDCCQRALLLERIVSECGKRIRTRQ